MILMFLMMVIMVMMIWQGTRKRRGRKRYIQTWKGIRKRRSRRKSKRRRRRKRMKKKKVKTSITLVQRQEKRIINQLNIYLVQFTNYQKQNNILLCARTSNRKSSKHLRWFGSLTHLCCGGLPGPHAGYPTYSHLFFLSSHFSLAGQGMWWTWPLEQLIKP